MGTYDWMKKRSGGSLGLGRRLNHCLPFVIPLDSDARRLAGCLPVQPQMWPYVVVVGPEAGQDRRVVLLESANDLLTMP